MFTRYLPRRKFQIVEFMLVWAALVIPQELITRHPEKYLQGEVISAGFGAAIVSGVVAALADKRAKLEGTVGDATTDDGPERPE